MVAFLLVVVFLMVLADGILMDFFLPADFLVDILMDEPVFFLFPVLARGIVLTSLCL